MAPSLGANIMHFPLETVDGKTMLKIWNLNKYTGVIGVFNCQGGGWFPETRTNKAAAEFSHVVSTKTNPQDIEWKPGDFSIQGVEAFTMYFHQTKKVVLSKSASDGGDDVEVSLEPFNFELITVSPVTVLPGKSAVHFAPIGLLNMLNTGGAIQFLAFNEDLAEVGVKGGGEMRIFASERPKACMIDGEEVEFGYEEGMVVIQVPWPGSSRLSLVQYKF